MRRLRDITKAQAAEEALRIRERNERAHAVAAGLLARLDPIESPDDPISGPRPPEVPDDTDTHQHDYDYYVQDDD